MHCARWLTIEPLHAPVVQRRDVHGDAVTAIWAENACVGVFSVAVVVIVEDVGPSACNVNPVPSPKVGAPLLAAWAVRALRGVRRVHFIRGRALDLLLQKAIPLGLG